MTLSCVDRSIYLLTEERAKIRREIGHKTNNLTSALLTFTLESSSESKFEDLSLSEDEDTSHKESASSASSISSVTAPE